MFILNDAFFVKSFEDDFVLKSVIGGKKVSSQSLKEIVETKTILPNTFSFGKTKRLACSILAKNYLKTYRSQGLIFQTPNAPTEIYPFDLAVLAKTNKVIVRYYKIKDSLAEYYGANLVLGHEKFSFKTLEEMLATFSSPKSVWQEVNSLRVAAGYKELLKSKFKLVEYNEAIFDGPIKITPVAIFGYRKEARALAKELGVPYCKTAKEFYAKINE